MIISFTGADNNTDPVRLRELTIAHYDTIEWAILLFPEKEGTPRNPTYAKRMEIVEEVTPQWTAAHLCGELVFREILAGDKSRLTELAIYNRLQLNINARKPIFTDDEILRIYHTLHDQNANIIVQYHADSAAVIKRYCEQIPSYRAPDALFDTSKGKGIVPSEWPSPLYGMYCGYAGGISPDNVAQVRADVEKKTQGMPYWLDMETGVRTNNEFDVDKCWKVMENYGVNITP